MKGLKFTFRREAAWLVLFSFAPIVCAVFVVVIGWMLGRIP